MKELPQVMIPAQPRDMIRRVLHADGTVHVGHLAADLEVSKMTIQRDLQALDARGFLRRLARSQQHQEER